MLHLSRGSRPKEEVPAKLSQREVQSLGVEDNGTVCATAKQTLAREGLTGIKTPDRARINKAINRQLNSQLRLNRNYYKLHHN